MLSSRAGCWGSGGGRRRLELAIAAWRASRQSPTPPPCSSATGHRYAAASTTASMPARRMLASPAAFAVCRLAPPLGPLASTAGPPAADVATRRVGLAHKSGAIGAAQAACPPPPHHQACSSASARAPQPAAYWSVSRYLPRQCRQRPLVKRAPGRNLEWRGAVQKEGSGAATEHAHERKAWQPPAASTRARARGKPGGESGCVAGSCSERGSSMQGCDCKPGLQSSHFHGSQQ